MAARNAANLRALLADRSQELPPGARILHDLEGPAVYLIEGPTNDCTLVGCFVCDPPTITLATSIPKRPTTWTCQRCATIHRLTPPFDVMARALRPAMVP